MPRYFRRTPSWALGVCAGFSVLEALIAAGLLAIGLGGAMQLSTLSQQQLSLAYAQGEAALIASNVAAALHAGLSPAAAEQHFSGEVATRLSAGQLRITPVSATMTAPFATPDSQQIALQWQHLGAAQHYTLNVQP